MTTNTSQYNREYRAKNRDRLLSKQRLWNAANPESVRTSKLKYKFGLLSGQYEQMLSSQSGVCAICSKPCPTGRRLAVDHCHKTGKVRQLLCHFCNKGLGFFSDSPELLEIARKYLQKHSELPERFVV